jgi:aspartate racemase
MKTIGVLGGLGPQATMDFVARLHAVSQLLIPQPSGNSGYPPLAVYYHRKPPVLLGDDRGVKWLGQTADFLVITANVPHMMADLIEEAAGIPLLNMVELTLAEIARRSWHHIGALALGEPKVYSGPLSEQGQKVEEIGSPLRDLLDQAILRLMAGHTSNEETAVALEAVEELRSRGVDGIILGCTEIPLLLGETANAADLINPAQLLADAAVRLAANNDLMPALVDADTPR